MVIYLRHPKHGEKVACSEQEADNDRANGWVRFDPKKPEKAAEVPADPEKQDEPVNMLELRERYREKFGTYPHHRKSVDTILKELAV